MTRKKSSRSGKWKGPVSVRKPDTNQNVKETIDKRSNGVVPFNSEEVNNGPMVLAEASLNSNRKGTTSVHRPVQDSSAQKSEEEWKDVTMGIKKQKYVDKVEANRVSKSGRGRRYRGSQRSGNFQGVRGSDNICVDSKSERKSQDYSCGSANQGVHNPKESGRQQPEVPSEIAGGGSSFSHNSRHTGRQENYRSPRNESGVYNQRKNWSDYGRRAVNYQNEPLQNTERNNRGSSKFSVNSQPLDPENNQEEGAHNRVSSSRPPIPQTSATSSRGRGVAQGSEGGFNGSRRRGYRSGPLESNNRGYLGSRKLSGRQNSSQLEPKFNGQDLSNQNEFPVLPGSAFQKRGHFESTTGSYRQQTGAAGIISRGNSQQRSWNSQQKIRAPVDASRQREEPFNNGSNRMDTDLIRNSSVEKEPGYSRTYVSKNSGQVLSSVHRRDVPKNLMTPTGSYEWRGSNSTPNRYTVFTVAPELSLKEADEDLKRVQRNSFPADMGTMELAGFLSMVLNMPSIVSMHISACRGTSESLLAAIQDCGCYKSAAVNGMKCPECRSHIRNSKNAADAVGVYEKILGIYENISRLIGQMYPVFIERKEKLLNDGTKAIAAEIIKCQLQKQ